MKAVWSAEGSILCVYCAPFPFVLFSSCTVDFCSQLKCLRRTWALQARRGMGGMGPLHLNIASKPHPYSVMQNHLPSTFLLKQGTPQPPIVLQCAGSDLSKGCRVEWLLLLRAFKRFNMWHHCQSCHCCLGIYSQLWERLLAMCQAARQQKLPTSMIYSQPFRARIVLPQATSGLKNMRTVSWQSDLHLPLVKQNILFEGEMTFLVAYSRICFPWWQMV
jgi:hypothetical protein